MQKHGPGSPQSPKAPAAPSTYQGVVAGAVTVMATFAVTELPALSATRIATEEVPAVVGVPLITPVVELRLNPAGMLPSAVQVNGGWPPLADNA